MKVYTLKRRQLLPISLEEAWKYFSSPGNLPNITPPKLGFEILSQIPLKMYQGMVIHYFIKPFLNLRMKWVTEITHVNEPYFFVDEQRAGPYRLWHHQHKFTETREGVIMEDEVNYALPFGIVGRIVHVFFVKSELNYIFEFRKNVLKSIFTENLKIRKGAA